MNEIKEYPDKIFEDIKHKDENDNEYWMARELMTVWEYKEWRKFDKVIKKAMEACEGSNYYIFDHFAFKDKMVNLFFKIKCLKWQIRKVENLCYWIVIQKRLWI